MQLYKLAFCLSFQIIVPVLLQAQQVAAPVEISVKAIMAKPVETNGYSTGFGLSPQVQARIGTGKLGLNTEFGTGSFSQNSIMDEYPALSKYSRQSGSSKWRNTYLALGPTYRLLADKRNTTLVDFAFMGGVAFNKSEAYSVQFNPEIDIKESLQKNTEIKKSLPIIKPSISITKYWGNWGVNIYSSWQKSIGEYSYKTSQKDLSAVNFTSDEGMISKQIISAPTVEISNNFPASMIQFGVGVSYSIGRKNTGEHPQPAKANINTSRSNIKQQVSKKDLTGNSGNDNGEQPTPAKANINTSRSNIKQQVSKKDSTGNTGNDNSGQPQPAEASINTSRSNIKQQVGKIDTTRNTGNDNNGQPQRAEASINTSRSNIKQQVGKKDSTRNTGNDNGEQPQPAKANINTSRSNIKQQVSKKDSTGNSGNDNGEQPQPAKANNNTSRSNKKSQLDKSDATSNPDNVINDGNQPEPAKANYNTARTNKKAVKAKSAATIKNGKKPKPAKANINTSRSNKKSQ